MRVYFVNKGYKISEWLFFENQSYVPVVVSDSVQNKHSFVIYVVHHAFVHDETNTAFSLLYNLSNLKF